MVEKTYNKAKFINKCTSISDEEIVDGDGDDIFPNPDTKIDYHENNAKQDDNEEEQIKPSIFHAPWLEGFQRKKSINHFPIKPTDFRKKVNKTIF